MKTPTLLVLLFLAQIQTGWGQITNRFDSIAPGLQLAKFKLSQASPVGGQVLHVLRVDPSKWEFQLFSSKFIDSKPRTAPQWAKEFNLSFVINAGMFREDGQTNVGYCKVDSLLNNAKTGKDMAFVAMESSIPGQPKFKIIDRDCDSWQKDVSQYKFVSQGIRMIDCKQRNKWSQQPRIWSMALAGIDAEGNALFCFSRSPYSVHDLIDQMLKIDHLSIQRAMYLEGGPEASFYLKAGKIELNLFGSYETGFFESDGNDRPWPIPNIFGIRPRMAD